MADSITREEKIAILNDLRRILVSKLRSVEIKLDELVIPESIPTEKIIEEFKQHYWSGNDVSCFLVIDMRCNWFISSARAQQFPIYGLRLSRNQEPQIAISYINLYNPKFKDLNNIISQFSIIDRKPFCYYVRTSKSLSINNPLIYTMIFKDGWSRLYDAILKDLGATEKV